MTTPLRRALARFEQHPVRNPRFMVERDESGKPCRWCVWGALDREGEFDRNEFDRIALQFTLGDIDHAEAVARFRAIVEAVEAKS